VQSAAENKMPFKQRACFTKNLQCFGRCHAGSLKG
jgi:hypothetical protein